MPTSCHSIVITDAGFRTPWFNKVASLGWDWIGRIRSNARYQNKKGCWLSISSLHKTATKQISSLGQVMLTKINPTKVYLFTVKKPKKNHSTKHKASSKKANEMTKRHQRAANEPWVIASSMNQKLSVIKNYEKRMQIEQTFRDVKSTRNGFAFNHHGTSCVDRLNVLLLIAALATFVLWLIGRTGEAKNHHYKFQANTCRDRRVLSFVFLGKQMIKHCLELV